MLSFSTTILNNMLNTVVAGIDSGSSVGKLLIYSGPKPRPGEAVTTQILLAELDFSDPSGVAAADASLTFTAVVPSQAVGEGQAVWCRGVNSSDVYVFDAGIGAADSNSDVRINDTAILIGNPVVVSTINIKVSA